MSIGDKNKEEYFQPPIVRERTISGNDSEAALEDLDGDTYFEPPIVREQNITKDDLMSGVFGEFQKCRPIVLQALIRALDSSSALDSNSTLDTNSSGHKK
jgi:hypothetical protein